MQSHGQLLRLARSFTIVPFPARLGVDSLSRFVIPSDHREEASEHPALREHDRDAPLPFPQEQPFHDNLPAPLAALAQYGAIMETKKNPVVGFIGYGNMAEAIMRGLVQGFVTPASNIHICDHHKERLALADDIGCNTYTSAVDVVKASEVVLVCVKPKDMEAVLKEIAPAAGTSTVIVSIAAGVTIDKMQKCLAKNARIIRVMPNTPCLVREGCSSITGDKDATPEDMDLVETIMSSLGVCVRVEENLIDAIVGVSGSGPAYVYMMIEAMADGGVLCGLNRRDATRLAAQTLLGGARMVLETGKHPGQLKDEVCSPNGTTIRAVHALEQAGLRSALMNGVIASKTRSEELGRK